MSSFEDIIANEEVKKEYRKAFLLNLFKKIVVRMNKDNAYKLSIKRLFIQSTDKLITVKVIIKNTYQFDLDAGDEKVILQWFEAYFKKSSRRRPIPGELKTKLYHAQNGICALCGEPLGEDMSKIHVDHIIPWVLVGDELNDNYQCLCEVCNECKSAQTDYIFRYLLKLN